jgi:tetratricopeptide (TPR) repeat protein
VTSTPSRLIVFVLVALTLTPAAGLAQNAQFFDALLPLYRELAGTYGDEGPQVSASVETMSQALARWDAAMREQEAAMRGRLGGAGPQAAMQAHTVLASMYSERSRYRDALRELDEDIRLDPKRAVFHRFKALIDLALDRRAAAAAAFRSAWLAEPADPLNAYGVIVHRVAGSAVAEGTRADETLAALEQALVRGERPAAASPFISLRAINDDTGGAMAFAPAAYAQAIAQLLDGQIEMGMAALREAVAADPLVADPAVRREPARRGIAALRQGQMAEAIDALKAATAGAPESSELRRILATAVIVDGNVAAGVQSLREAVRLDPRNERAWLALARTLDDIDQPVDAVQALHQAVANLPASGELRWQLSIMSGKRQRTDAADLDLIATADRLVLLAGTGELYERVATLAQGHLEYDRALSLRQHAVLLTPNNARAHQALGQAYVDQGRDEEGYAELVIALWLDPADAGTLTALGRLHLAAGRLPASIDALTRAVALQSGNAEAVHGLREALVRAGRTAEADQRLAEAERLEARAVEAQRRGRTLGMLSLQAELHMSNHDYDDAIEAWRQAAALEGRSAAAHLGLATALIAATRLDAAAAELQVAITLNAGIDVHRRLADVYAALGRADDSARERRTYTEQRLQELQQRAAP